MSLSPGEIQLRMQELRNLRRLHAAQKVRIELQNEQIRLLKEENALLSDRCASLERTVENFSLQIEELRTIVFGKKRKKRDEHDDTPPRGPSTSRTPDSYRRPVPSDDLVTETKHHRIDTCTTCTGPFTRTRTKEYFEEDLPPPQKSVIKHVVEQGYCTPCRAWRTSAPLPSSRVILGENVKRHVTYLSVVSRQSYGQIRELLHDRYQFELSSGEVAKILETQGIRLRPEYERLKASIRGEPSVHLDETGWPLQEKDGYHRYAWTMTGGATGDAVYALGKTRGKGNAETLLGDSPAVLVSDDYRAYRNLDHPHQLCLAHIHRKLRDLAGSDALSATVREHCKGAYQTFASLYADIETARTSPDSMSAYDVLLARLHAFAEASPEDPKKLAAVKAQVRDRASRYLTCLEHPDVAPDNNAAERSLRHLVIKRKTSFGSFSERTAGTLAVLTSVLLSYRRQGILGGYLRGV